MTRFLISAIIAIALMGGLLFASGIPSSGPNIFSKLLLPFYLLGVGFSHNVHQPNEAAVYGSMFLFFFGITFALLAVIARIRRGH